MAQPKVSKSVPKKFSKKVKTAKSKSLNTKKTTKPVAVPAPAPAKKAVASNSVPTPTPKGGALKHRKVLRDNIQGITKNALARLLHRAGVKRISGLVYEDLRQRLKMKVEDIAKNAVIFTEHDHRKTVMDKDIYSSAEQMGEVLAVGINKKAKTSATSVFHKGPSTHTSVGGTTAPVAGGVKKPHKFHAGTVTLREIRKQQKSSGLLIPKTNFERVLREVTQDYHTDLRFQKNAILLVQVWVEDYIVHLAEGANLVAIHSGRETVQVKDVDLVMRLRNTKC